MKTQLSRNSFDAKKRYSGIYQQMGRMLTDADWNELTDLSKSRLADALTDIIGSGTPRDRGLVRIAENPDGSKSYTLQWGYCYVDGIIAQVRPDPAATLTDPTGVAFEYEHQADFRVRRRYPQGIISSMSMSGNVRLLHWKINNCSIPACMVQIPVPVHKPWRR